MMPVNPFKLHAHFRKDGEGEIADDMEIEFYLWEAAAERAEEIVNDSFSEDDENFFFEMEQETKRQWEEDLEREQWKRGDW